MNLPPESNSLPELFTFFERLKTTGGIRRFGTLPTIQFESVASHSFNVTVISLMIADYEENPSINIETLIRKSLFHDFEESILSDIPHSIKHRYKGGRLAHLLKEIVPDLIEEEIFKELPKKLKDKYIKHTKEAKLDLEGKIVEAADAMDTTITSIREINLGNKYFHKVYDASIKLVEKHSSLKFVQLFLDKAAEYKASPTWPLAEDL